MLCEYCQLWCCKNIIIIVHKINVTIITCLQENWENMLMFLRYSDLMNLWKYKWHCKTIFDIIACVVVRILWEYCKTTVRQWPWDGSIHHSTNLFKKETLEKNCSHSSFTLRLRHLRKHFTWKDKKNILLCSDHWCTSAVEYDSSWWFPLLHLDIETFGIISSSSNRALDFENLGGQEVKTSLKTLRSDCCNAFNIRDIHLHNFCLFGTSPSSISMCHLTKARKIPQLILNFRRECWWSWCFELT